MSTKRHYLPAIHNTIVQFESIQKRTERFVDPSIPSIIRGLIISGPGGVGKTHYVEKGLSERVDNDNVRRLKGDITAAGLYVELCLTKEKGSLLVLDDVNILTKGAQERSTILSLLKAATETNATNRKVTWTRAKANPMLEELGFGPEIEYHGSVIWITNNTFDEMESKMGSDYTAIMSRFYRAEIRMSLEDKTAYTLYLITDCEFFGKNCSVKKGGFPQKDIDTLVEYMYENYNKFEDMAPRTAEKLMDAIVSDPTGWKDSVPMEFFKRY